MAFCFINLVYHSWVTMVQGSMLLVADCINNRFSFNKTKNQIFRSGLVRETGLDSHRATRFGHSRLWSSTGASFTTAPTSSPFDVSRTIVSIKQKTRSFDLVWCERRDLNPYELPHTPLKRARLPIPPLSRIQFTLSSARILYHFQMGLSILFLIFF